MALVGVLPATHRNMGVITWRKPWLLVRSSVGKLTPERRRRTAVVASYRWDDEDHALRPTDLRERFQVAAALFNEGKFYA